MTAPVVEITQFRVEPPLVDHAPASLSRLGTFSAWTTALTWLSRRVAESGPHHVDGLFYFRLDEIVLDAELRIVRTLVFGADYRCRGIINGDGDKPWRGCPSEECRYKLGDIVGFVSPYAPEYRVGIVLAQPPTPEDARRGRLTVADNRYLVGTLDAEGKPETDAHSDVHRALIFPVEHDVPSEVRGALQRRGERHLR
jgi:hypothetical protein